MVWICLECGNDERFKGTQEVTEYTTQTCVFDRDGYSEVVLDTSFNDTDYEDSCVNECDECQSENITWIDSEGDIDKIKEFIENGMEYTELEKRIRSGRLEDDTPLINKETKWRDMLKKGDEDE